MNISNFITFTAGGLQIASFVEIREALIARYKEVYGTDIDLSTGTADGVFVNDLALITGQKPVVTKARKSVANFKLREGMPIGVRVTLRGARMYEFMERFIMIACPRIRDFQGFNPSFDGKGNLNLGIKEHYIFPEIDVEKSPKAHGMNIPFVTTAGNDKSGRLLMDYMGMPFRKSATK